jgi:hypothetical protein
LVAIYRLRMMSEPLREGEKPTGRHFECSRTLMVQRALPP